MKKQNQKVYIVSELESRDGYICHRVIFTSTDINRAKERNHQQIRSYIEDWHEGDEEEKYTKEQYYENGFNKTRNDPNFLGPKLIESWSLDEDDYFIEYSVTEATLDTGE